MQQQNVGDAAVKIMEGSKQIVGNVAVNIW